MPCHETAESPRCVIVSIGVASVGRTPPAVCSAFRTHSRSAVSVRSRSLAISPTVLPLLCTGPTASDLNSSVNAPPPSSRSCVLHALTSLAELGRWRYGSGMIDALPDYPAVQAIQRALWHVSDVRGAAVMVGSGFSMNAELASPASKAPPLWLHLAAAMDRQLGSESSGANNPLRLAEEFRALLGQAALDGLIRDLVPDAEWLPGIAHHRLLDLPWSDVLSTNWDTLLERAKAELIDRSYDVVLTPRDIARTRSPRIVKLHGSLPSHTPFIFAEEDYRTYPVKFAPFVNLAQHVLLENELLLLGFSADDPNFLAWAGWVRDQLGTSARRIRLAGVLNLTAARRRYLENLNVTPIDLAPLVETIEEPSARHAKATKLLLDSLHGAKPIPIHVWTRTKQLSDKEWKNSNAGERIVQLIGSWVADRKCAPSWLVAPHSERFRLRMETFEIAARAVEDLEKIPAEQRGRFAAELGWRLETGHFGVPIWAKAPLEAVLAESNAKLTPIEHTRLRVLLSYQAIEERDDDSFDEHVAKLAAAHGEDAEAAPWAAYLRGLAARDRLDITEVVAAIPNIVGSDPVWLFRRAALLSAICDSTGAARLVRVAILELRRRRSLDRRSLWLLSREAWGRFLWRSLTFELRKDDEGKLELGEDWPLVYDEHNIDPWDELNALDHEIRREQDRERKSSGAEITHFEAGAWTQPRRGPTYWVANWVVPSEFQIRRLADFVGVPPDSGSADILIQRLTRSVPARGPQSGAAALWRVASYLRSEKDDLIGDWFGRLEVAALPLPLIDALSSALRGSIEYLASTLTSHDDGHDHRIQRLQTLLELLSRLSVRADSTVADGLIELAIATFEQGAAEHWWLYQATANLISRSLSAIPPAERGRYAGKMLDFPLPAERKAGGPEREWPEFSDVFRHREVVIERSDGAWSERIATLIAWVAKDRSDQRHRAIRRLWLLQEKRVLSEAETQQFAQALWSWRQSTHGLPADESFLPGAMALLPEPAPGMAAAGFDHDVVQPLLEGKVERGSLESLAYLGSEADRGNGSRPFSPAIAARLIKSIPKPAHEKDRYPTASAIFSGLLPVAEIDDAIAAALWDRANASDADAAIVFLPYIARHDASRTDEATVRLRRAMYTRDLTSVEAALHAVRQWARIVECDKFPASLAATVASLVAIRREPGLFRAIEVCVDLVERRLLANDDVGRVLEGLEELLVETSYENWRQGDFRTATLTYVRANSFRLARALKRAGHSDAVIEGWIAAGIADPDPEVRFVSDEDE